MYTWKDAVARCKDIATRHGKGQLIVENLAVRLSEPARADRYEVVPNNHKPGPLVRPRAAVHGATGVLTRFDRDPT